LELSAQNSLESGELTSIALAQELKLRDQAEERRQRLEHRAFFTKELVWQEAVSKHPTPHRKPPTLPPQVTSSFTRVSVKRKLRSKQQGEDVDDEGETVDWLSAQGLVDRRSSNRSFAMI
jgi:hypothetical protein